MENSIHYKIRDADHLCSNYFHLSYLSAITQTEGIHSGRHKPISIKISEDLFELHPLRVTGSDRTGCGYAEVSLSFPVPDYKTLSQKVVIAFAGQEESSRKLI